MALSVALDHVEFPDDLSFEQFVRTLLRDPREIGLPLGYLDDEDLERVYRRLRGRRPEQHPLELAVADGFRVVLSCLPDRCGGSTARLLHLPYHRDPAERRLSAAHEWLHGRAKRIGVTLANEVDFWRLTARMAVEASGTGLYPGWATG